jgi:hypothetical protein
MTRRRRAKPDKPAFEAGEDFEFSELVPLVGFSTEVTHESVTIF